ncbi:RHS repeat-associated core domain-containing protein [Rothia nasimurium]|uniref:RHS repeat-associated core domain-containing protein n=1 Tax=Rothia nasimurium TaxID=85336 RepID=UPI001F2DA12C|nr:RHS repeat-associated core domain-containing protein [Rothia nasimurium]
MAAAVPSIARIGQVPVSLATGVSTVPTGVRGVDPFGLSPVAGLQGTGSGVALAGVGVTAAGSLALGGLEILGVRVYDPVARGFMSVDPLASPVGAGWGANVYAFVGNAPVGLVDPWGLSPMTAGEFREYRQDSSARAWERLGGQLHRWADEHAEAIATAAIIAGTVVSVAALVATGPVGLIVAGAVGGGLLSGGLSILTNRGEDGRVDWGKVGLDTLIGAATGTIAGAGTAATKLTMAVTKSASRFVGSVAVNAGINFTTGAVGGGFGAAVGGFFGPGSGTLSKGSPYLNKKVTEIGINFAGGVGAEALSSTISGEETNLRKILVSGGTSAVFSQVPVSKPVNSNTLNQASYTSPSTFRGAFTGVQSSRMWRGGAQGSVLSGVSDISLGSTLKGE